MIYLLEINDLSIQTVKTNVWTNFILKNSPQKQFHHKPLSGIVKSLSPVILELFVIFSIACYELCIRNLDFSFKTNIPKNPDKGFLTLLRKSSPNSSTEKRCWMNVQNAGAEWFNNSHAWIFISLTFSWISEILMRRRLWSRGSLEQQGSTGT